MACPGSCATQPPDARRASADARRRANRGALERLLALIAPLMTSANGAATWARLRVSFDVSGADFARASAP